MNALQAIINHFDSFFKRYGIKSDDQIIDELFDTPELKNLLAQVYLKGVNTEVKIKGKIIKIEFN